MARQAQAQPNRGGRPTKRGPAVTKELVRLLQNGNTRMAAAKATGIDYSTLKRWCNLSAPFRAELEKAEALGETLYVGDITMAARSGNWQAAAWWLERRRHGDWRKPAEQHEHSGRDGGPIEQVSLSAEELADRIAAIYARVVPEGDE